MLTTEENEFLCRVGQGTPMGNFVRRFWTPILLASELPEPDCAPMRSRIFCEDLVAFRNSDGVIGLVDQFCPHRRASLFFGRNEERGLRCVYHGWKFDVEGQCVDMPSEPADSNFKDKMQITAYPTREAGGMVWAYLGPKELMPPMPGLEYTELPDSQVYPTKIRYESNFVQVIEGEIDTVHVAFLHSRLADLENSATATTLAGRYTARDRAARFHIQDTDGGILIGAERHAEEDSYYWRISRWLFPFFTMIPREPMGPVSGGALVPIDDENCWFFRIKWNPYKALTPAERAVNDFSSNILPDGSWLNQANKSNDYLIDREAQRTNNYTGIPDGRAQDAAMTDGMGAIVDRNHEHLSSTDQAIIRMRRRLIQAARDLEEGVEPYAANHPECYKVRSGGALLPRDVFFTDDPAVWDDITVK